MDEMLQSIDTGSLNGYKNQKEHKDKIKENHQTTKRKRNEQRRNIDSTGKQGLKWQ